MEEGDYEDRNPYSKHFEKNYEKDLLCEKPENSDLNCKSTKIYGNKIDTRHLEDFLQKATGVMTRRQ